MIQHRHNPEGFSDSHVGQGKPLGGSRFRRWGKRFVLGLLALLVVAAVAGSVYQRVGERNDLRLYAPVGEMVDIGGYRLHLYCTGEGQPTVVMDAGLGNSSLIWSFVQPEVARATRVCSYDRAGLGWSDASPLPRTSEQVAKELHALLEAASVPAPYVLVGHSLGGLHVRRFAYSYPDEVAGLVLVDPSHEEQNDLMPPLLNALIGGMYRGIGLTAAVGLPRALNAVLPEEETALSPEVQAMTQALNLQTRHLRTVSAEFSAAGASMADVKQIRRPLNVPVIVLSAGQAAAGMEGMKDAFGALHESIVQSSEDGKRITAHESGHYIHQSEPELVVAATLEIVEKARR